MAGEGGKMNQYTYFPFLFLTFSLNPSRDLKYIARLCFRLAEIQKGAHTKMHCNIFIQAPLVPIQNGLWPMNGDVITIFKVPVLHYLSHHKRQSCSSVPLSLRASLPVILQLQFRLANTIGLVKYLHRMIFQIVLVITYDFNPGFFSLQWIKEGLVSSARF